MERTAPPAGASICINPVTFSPVHETVFLSDLPHRTVVAPIYLSG